VFKWLLLSALLLLAPAPAWAQNQNSGIRPSGSFTPGHTVRCQNSTCTVAVDGGGSLGSNLNGQGYLTEIGITNTGTPFCINDALISSAGGYHQLCLGANALGGGLISYNANAGASPLNLQFNVNGSTFEFPGTGNGNVVGPVTTTASNIACWANGSGTLLKDGLLSSPCAAGVLSSTQLTNSVSALVTTQTVPGGSVGQGPVYVNDIRTGGFGQYGNALFHYEINAALPGTQFDTGLTSWAIGNNLTGGFVFGGWMGANTPAKNLGQTYTGGAAVGAEINFGNRWADPGLQTDVGGQRYTVGLQIVPDVLPATGADNSIALTSFSTGSPATFTLTSHGFYANMGVVFEGTAGITGITDGTTYYVAAAGLTSNNFEVSATVAGSAVNTTGTPSGTLKVLPSWPGSFGLVYGASVHGHQTYVQELTRFDATAPGGYIHFDFGGSTASGQPQNWARVAGNFVAGLDFTSSIFSSGIAIGLAPGQAIYFNGAQINGTGGAIAISPSGSGSAGALYGNSFGTHVVDWSVTGTTPSLGFFGTSPTTRPAITGALSAVTDANAKAVLTSIINALTALGLVTNGTT